jgi:hypothetical protein
VVCVGGEDLSSKQAALLLSLDRLIKQGQCEVTVLTGADDASAIAAYKLMKTVAESLGGRVHGLDQATGPANLRMSVCLAGTSAARADEAFARMADASRQFLASTLGRGVDVPKLTGLHSMSLHDRVSEHVVLEARLEQLREQLTSWIATRNTTAHTVPAASAAATTQTTGTQTTGSMHPSPLSPYSSHTPAAEPMNKSTAAATHLSVVGRPVEWAGHLDVSSGEPMAQVKLVMDDRGMMRPAAKHVAPQTVSQGLVVDGPAAVVRDESPATRATAPVAAPAGTMMFPGLTALSFRCPFEKSAILAIDEAGVLQVMVSHAGGPELGRDAAASKQAVAEATHRLITVGGWLSANGELLNLIAGGKINTAAKPVLHLLTDQPSCVRRLLDTEIRVHLVVDEAKLKQGAMAIALN